MAIRANQLTNFKGEPYATIPQVEAKVTELSSSVEVKIQAVDAKVQEIKEEVTDGLLDKDTGNLNAKYNPIKVLSTDNKTGLDPIALEEGGEASYYPDNDYSKIQFIGDCKVTYRNDGQIVIRIGDNLNSSNFATTDGQTTGVDNAIVGAPSGTSGVLADGTNVVAIKSGDYTIDTATENALIHFENNVNTSFEVAVEDDGVAKIYYFGPITGDGTYTAKLTNAEGADVSGVSMVVSNFTEETKTAEGATGYCGSVSFTIAASAMANGESSSVKITSVKHNNGGEGEFIDSALNANTRYFYTDTATVPVITADSAKVTITKSGNKIVSGVKYITSGTAKYDVSFSNIATPVCVGSNVIFDNNGWAQDKTVSAAYNATSATATGNLIQGSFDKDTAANKVTVTVKNINGNATASIDLAESLLVDTTTTVDAATIAYFNVETGSYPRLNSDLTNFDNTKVIGDADLMLKDGRLMYPAGDFSDYNTDIAATGLKLADGATSATANPNYSGLTGTRYWYRKFYEAGDKNGATLAFTTADNFSETSFGTAMIVEIGVLDANGVVKAWYDATKKSTESTVGIRTDSNVGNDKTPTLVVDWGANGAASYGVIIKLGLPEASAVKVDTLSVTFA